RLAGDAVDAVCQENRVIVHRRQAASHKNVFIQQITGCLIRGDLPGIGSKTCTRGVSDAIWGYAAHRCRRNL
ncbi:hypothetical protein ABNM31_05570, partial [Pseudomonas syringae]|uniref:hypothetical protein n=1 Tax=Pseudomonas syringae TaxID=317 RepID=UPI0032D95DDE